MPNFPLSAAVAESGAPLRPLRPSEVEPMLAETADDPWAGPEWVFELKVDGYRALAGVEDGPAGPRPSLVSRREADCILL